MSIFINGMDMPENCYVCQFMFHQRRVPEVWCTAIENHWLDLRKVLSCDRHDDCPITPVPAHGRLIDADALLQSHSVSDGIYFPDAYIPATAIKAAPTIIPAEPCNNLSKPCKEEDP